MPYSFLIDITAKGRFIKKAINKISNAFLFQKLFLNSFTKTGRTNAKTIQIIPASPATFLEVCILPKFVVNEPIKLQHNEMIVTPIGEYSLFFIKCSFNTQGRFSCVVSPIFFLILIIYGNMNIVNRITMYREK